MNKYCVAICDDEHEVCAMIENVVLNFAEQIHDSISAEVFLSGEELYKHIKDGCYFDLIFLDIEMNSLNGIDIGIKIREEFDNQTTQIIYISGKDHYYKSLFDVRPMHFLTKPLCAEKIIKDIQLAMKLSERFKGVFSYKKGHENYKTQLKDILYFESDDREIRIVTHDRKDKFYGKMEDIHAELAAHYFMHIHKSYLINYAHVVCFRYEEVVMSNTMRLPVSQSRRKEIRRLQTELIREGI